MHVDRTSASSISRRWRVAAAVVSMTLVVLVVGGWWVSHQGYVSWFGTACTDEGYDPAPSYDELVTKYRKSPYCARRIPRRDVVLSDALIYRWSRGRPLTYDDRSL